MKLCTPKVTRIPIVRISGLALESPSTKSHLDVVPVERLRVYYKGEGGGFPQVQAVMNLVCPSCLWFILTPKVLQLCTKVEIIIGNNVDKRVFIPRIIMSPSGTDWPFVLRRRQFPIRVAFAITINKSQG